MNAPTQSATVVGSGGAAPPTVTHRARAIADRVARALDQGEGPGQLPLIDAALVDMSLTGADRAALLLLRSRVHRQGMAYADMLVDATAAADLYRSLDDPGTEARAVAMAAIAAAECGDVVVAADLAVRARVTGDGWAEEPSSADPWVVNRIGIFCHQMLDLDAAVAWWEQGLVAARRARDIATEVLLVHNIVEATFTALRMCAVEQAGSVAATRIPTDGCGPADDLAGAEIGARWLAERSGGQRRMPVDGPRLLAQILATRGRVGEAWAALADARSGLGAETTEPVRASYDAAEGYILLQAGRPADALRALDRALAPRHGDAVDTETLLARADRAEALDRLGRSREALEESRRATAILLARLRRQGQGVLREVDLRAGHEIERSRLLRHADLLAADASRDPLTGAGNRRRLDALVLACAERSRVGVVAVDLDRFKSVNDRFGHGVGDRVLVATVALLSGCCRVGDEVVRLGGEEFALVCPDADAVAAAEVGERARAAVESHDWDEIQAGLRVTLSAGTASGPGPHLREVLTRADSALLRAKRRGRNRTCLAGDRVSAAGPFEPVVSAG